MTKDPILKAKIAAYKKDNDLTCEDDEFVWRRFLNFHFFSQLQPNRLDTDAELLDKICTDDSHLNGVSGISFFVNDKFISAKSDIDDILVADKKGGFSFYFLLTKDFYEALENIRSFFRLKKNENDADNDSWLGLCSYIFSQQIILKWKDKARLVVVLYQNEIDSKFESTFEDFKTFFINTNNFSEVQYVNLDDKKLLDITNSHENFYEKDFEFEDTPINIAGAENIDNAYIGVCKGGEIVDLITSADGFIRHSIFEENVRDFQGITTINHEMENTLLNAPEHFLFFNNGVTIICDKIESNKKKYKLTNPQIVNGCQTCNILYRSKKSNVPLDAVCVNVKIIGTESTDIVQGIVRGTNRQNIVYEEAFETIKDFHKNLEQFISINDIKGCHKIFYERRSKQFIDNSQIKPYQRVSFRILIQGVVSLCLRHAEDGHRHEFTLLKKYKDSIFVEGHSNYPYYAAALLNSNLDKLFRDGKLPRSLYTYKMHILLVIQEIAVGVPPSLTDSASTEEFYKRFLALIETSGLAFYAKCACDKFEDIRKKWIEQKGESFKFAIKDNIEFSRFMLKEIRGETVDLLLQKQYTGRILTVKKDVNGNLYGFIEKNPNNVFFHEFDNPAIDFSYIGKDVLYEIVQNQDSIRAVNVKLL